MFELRKLLQIAKRQIRKHRQDERCQRMRIAHQSQPDIVLARPPGMLRDRGDNLLGNIRFCKYLQDLAFTKKRIAERELNRLWMTLRQNGSRDSRRPSSRQS